jgi:signal transduction histidine kinase
MNKISLLQEFQPIWLEDISNILTQDQEIGQDLRSELDKFFALLIRVVETNDPTWLEPLISTWAASNTESDRENLQNTTTNFLRKISDLTYQICRNHYQSSETFLLLDQILPYLHFAIEKAAYYDNLIISEHIFQDAERVQKSLERLDKSKSGFIAVAAHELKTPLTLVEGYTAMLKDRLNDADNNQFENTLLEGINTGTNRLLAIINDMIDVSLIDNNLLELNFQPLWLKHIITKLRAELNDDIKERNLNFIIDDFEGSSDMTYGDPERIQQVFRNVLLNAVKFTPDGGSIRVNGRKLPGFLETIIADSGIGIAPENQLLIFEKFHRIGNIDLHSSGKTKFKGGGPGLGLHIAKGVMEAHGGAIWVESPGYDEKTFPGSTFHILIPLISVPPNIKTSKLFTK